MASSSLPWIEKYRPHKIDDVLDHQSKLQALRRSLDKDALPHLLFYGPPGTGKTTTILALAREMYGTLSPKNILELNASEDRGIETVRHKIPNFISLKSDRLKLIILDEAESMTVEAQAALNRLIETQSQRCRFCLICNDVGKIRHGIQSRCTKIRFNRLSPSQLKKKLYSILEKEQVSIQTEAMDYLVQSEMDMRQCINILHCIAQEKQMNIENQEEICPITKEKIQEFLGVPTKEELGEWIQTVQSKDYHKNIRGLIHFVDTSLDGTWSLDTFLDYLIEYLIHDSPFSFHDSYLSFIEQLCELRYTFTRVLRRSLFIHHLSILLYRHFHLKQTKRTIRKEMKQSNK